MTDRSELWTTLRVLTWTAERFARAGLGAPRLDAEVLLADVLSTERIQLYAQHDKPLAPEELERYRQVVRRRLAREPVAYITGRREFWSLTLEVDRRVLIPRPETELLVELALKRAAALERPRLLDVGTGSGALAIALARELQRATVWATEASAGALTVARRNVERHAAAVTLLEGDLLAPLPAELTLDLIVSNPPYVASGDLLGLEPEVRDFEPRAALDGGPDGLEVVRRLVPQAAARLVPGGWLALEIGCRQAALVRRLLEEHGFEEVRAHKDLAGLDRVVEGRRPLSRGA